MMDPTGGGVGKAAGELLKEMQQSQKDLQKPEQQKGVGGNDGSFQNTLQTQQTQSTSAPTQVNKAQEVSKSSNVLMNARVNSTPPTTKVGATSRTARSKWPA